MCDKFFAMFLALFVQVGDWEKLAAVGTAEPTIDADLQAWPMPL